MGYDDSVKMSLALAWRLKRVLALGFSYHWFLADGDSPMDLGDDAGLGSSVPLQSASSRSPEDDGEKGAVRRRPAAADTDAMDVDEAPPAKSPRMQAPGES